MSRTPPSDITVTLRCNNDCVFCPRTTLRHVKVRDEKELLRRLEAIRAHSHRVTLSGGEVTILPDIVDLVRTCRQVGFTDVAIITNGRALSRPSLARDLVRAGLTEICVTVYDLRPRVHDWFTRTPGSLAETLQGLDVVLEIARHEPDLNVRVNTLLSTRNADGLVEMIRRLTARGVTGFLVADVVLGEHFDEPLPHALVRRTARAVASSPEVDASRVVFRGFPLCILRDIEGLRSEPMDIDTTLVDERSLDAYFAEFFDNFTHVQACRRCSLSDRCPGIQKLYMDILGSDSLSPVLSAAIPDQVKEDVQDFAPSPDPGRIAVTPTTACQMRCTYCQVKLGKANAPPEVLDAAVDLLLTSRRDRVELQLFGGEPLLRRREVRRTMTRAHDLAQRKNKRILFTVTTNGLLLDADMIEFLEGFETRVLFSMDGPPDLMARYRPLKTPRPGACRTIEENLRRLIESRIPHFVNIVAVPETVAELPSSLRYLARLGVSTVQICYALGPHWDRGSMQAFCDGLRACAHVVRKLHEGGTSLRLQNLGSDAEPVVLSNDLLVDVDGTLYGDAALFAEKAFPGLRSRYRIGSVFELETFDGLRRSRERNLADLRATFPESTPERETVEMHLAMGRMVQNTLDEIGDPLSSTRTTGTADRNPLLDTVLKRSLPAQAKLMRAHPTILKLPLLLLQNPCAWDCLFCKAKPMPPTSFESVALWLAGNAEANLTRLGLVGNEPLAHPQIDRIIARAREHGFTRFDALTTGDPVADPARARDLFDAGVTAYSVPLFGSTPDVHDAVTGSPGSHVRSMAAIENLMDLGATIHVHTNLIRQNLDDLSRLERLVRNRLGLPFCVIPVRPKDANLPFRELVVPYADVIQRAHVQTLVAFPLCVASRVQDPPVPDASIISDPLKVYVLDQPFVKPSVCDGCARRGRCAGTFQAYLDLHGTAHLTPF